MLNAIERWSEEEGKMSIGLGHRGDPYNLLRTWVKWGESYPDWSGLKGEGGISNCPQQVQTSLQERQAKSRGWQGVWSPKRIIFKRKIWNLVGVWNRVSEVYSWEEFPRAGWREDIWKSVTAFEKVRGDVIQRTCRGTSLWKEATRSWWMGPGFLAVATRLGPCNLQNEVT